MTSVVRNSTPQGVGRALADATLTGVRRHGKWLWLTTDARRDLLVHLGMTGSFHHHADDEEPCEEDHVRLALDGGSVVALHMTRKLGGVWLARDEAEREEITGRLGPDALEVDAEDLQELLGGSRAGLKSALMSQEKVAGVGNLLSDEVCWQARLHPRTPCTSLDRDDGEHVAEELARALDVGLDLGQVPTAEGFLTDVRNDDEPRCPRCGAELAGDTVAGRTSWWCPEEQPAPG